MREQHPLSPEDRRKKLAADTAAFGHAVAERTQPKTTAWEIVKRIAIGVYNDGFIHAGNLAFLALLALFPFFITAAAIAKLLGQSEDGQRTVATILSKFGLDLIGFNQSLFEIIGLTSSIPQAFFNRIANLVKFEVPPAERVRHVRSQSRK